MRLATMSGQWRVWIAERQQLFVAALLVLAVVALYWPSFAFPWLYDDTALVVANPDIRSLADFMTNKVPGRPLRELTLLLDYRFFGLVPAGYHLQNLFWHLACGGMLFVVVRKVLRSDWCAWAAAAIFLFHPLCVEVLAQASHRKDSLCLFFSLAALACWIEHYCCVVRWRMRLLALILTAIAFAAKENALAVVPLFLLVDLLLVSRETRLLRWDRRTILCWVGVGLLFAAFVAWVVMRSGGRFALGVEGFYLQTLKANVFMLSKALLPLDLSPEYTLIPPSSLLDPWIFAAAAVFVAVLLLYRLVRDPGFRFFLWFVPVMLLPTANLFGQVAYAAADRYMYTPLAGIAALVAWGLARLPQRTVLLVVLLVLLGWGTVAQQQVWSSPLNFYRHVVTVNPFVGVSGKSNIFLLNLAEEERKAGHDAIAMVLFRRCFDLTPLKHEAMIGLADLYEARGELAQAVAVLEEATAVAGERADTLAYLVALVLKSGDPAKGERLGLRYLALFPPDAAVLSNLGVACERHGDLVRAAGYHRQALTLDPDYHIARFNLAQVLIKQLERDAAIVELRRILLKTPDDVRVLSSLGEQLVASGRLAELSPVLEWLRRHDAGRASRLQALAEAATSVGRKP